MARYRSKTLPLLFSSYLLLFSGDGECEVDPDYINPVGLTGTNLPDRGYFGGVRGEVEVTKYDEDDTTPAPYYEDEDLISGGSSSSSSSSSSTYINRTTTINKKITSSSTINKVKTETSKSSKESATSGRISSSSSGYDDDEYDYYDYEDYPDETYEDTKKTVTDGSVRRTHSRVSRKVYNRKETSGSRDTVKPYDSDDSYSSSSSRVVSHSSSGSSGSDLNNELHGQDSGREYSSGTWKHSSQDLSSGRQGQFSPSERGREGLSSSGSEYDRKPYENKVSSSSTVGRTQTSRVITSEDSDGEQDRFDLSGSRGSDTERNRGKDFDRRYYESSSGRGHDGGSGRDFDSSSGRYYGSSSGGDRDSGRGREFSSSNRRYYESSSGRNHDGASERDFDSSSGGYHGSSSRRDHDGTRGRNFDSSRGGYYDRRSQEGSSGGDGSSGRDESGSYDFDSGWQSKTYAGGKGREDRRESRKSYSGSDGSRVTENRSEFRHSYVDNDIHPNSSTHHTRRVYSGQSNFNDDRHNRIDDGDRHSGYESSSSYPSRQFDRSGPTSQNFDDDGTSYRRSYSSHSSRSSIKSTDGDLHGSQVFDGTHPNPSQENEIHSSRQYNRRITKTYNRDDRRHDNPSNIDRSSHSSWSSSSRYGGAHSGDNTNTRWSSGGYRNEQDGAREDGRRRVTTQDQDRSGSQYHDQDRSSDGGRTYARAEVDSSTGEARVYSKHVYDDHSSDWQQVGDSSPGNGRIFPGSDSDGKLHHSVHRLKRNSEVVVEPEAYTDAQTGKTLQVVNLVSKLVF